MLGNIFFLFASAAFAIGAGLVLSGKFLPLKYDGATNAVVAILMVSVFVLFCTCSGCCGTINQVKRSGKRNVRNTYCSCKRQTKLTSRNFVPLLSKCDYFGGSQ